MREQELLRRETALQGQHAVLEIQRAAASRERELLDTIHEKEVHVRRLEVERAGPHVIHTQGTQTLASSRSTSSVSSNTTSSVLQATHSSTLHSSNTTSSVLQATHSSSLHSSSLHSSSLHSSSLHSSSRSVRDASSTHSVSSSQRTGGSEDIADEAVSASSHDISESIHVQSVHSSSVSHVSSMHDAAPSAVSSDLSRTQHAADDEYEDDFEDDAPTASHSAHSQLSTASSRGPLQHGDERSSAFFCSSFFECLYFLFPLTLNLLILLLFSLIFFFFFVYF
jgi:hypothetical protein